MNEWRRVADNGLTPGCETWQRDVKDGHLTVIVGREPGVGWHLSISHRTNHAQPRPGRNPKWNEIKDARYRFTPPAVTMCIILPPPDEHVNVHETCFHLWEHAASLPPRLVPAAGCRRPGPGADRRGPADGPGRPDDRPVSLRSGGLPWNGAS